MLTKIYIILSESIVYVITQIIFWGREKAQKGGEILPKLSPKLGNFRIIS